MLQSKMQCPTGIQWERFLCDDLDALTCESLEQHLTECHACGNYFKKEFDAQPDSLEISVAAAIGVSRVGNSPDEVAEESPEQKDAENELVKSLIARITGLSHPHESSEQPLAQERAAEVLWLLEPGREPHSLGCLAHYDLLEILGAGSSGVVFAARDQLLQRVVAIKILRPSLGATAQARFLSEARAIASLVHENIVTIYEVGQDQGLAYFTMPWLPGETLEKRLQRVTFLPEHETRELTKQICTALDAAHQRQLVHRDIKPANIWLDSKNGQYKLLDFGLARAAELDVTLTATGVLAGTPSYMSPEQARGEELDHRSDLFSLGCLMYRCMTGRLPFVGSGILATLQAIQHREPPAPSELNATCSADMSRLILALLSKDPRSRPASANEVRHAIDHSQVTWPFLPQAKPEPTDAAESRRTQTSTGGPTKAISAGNRPPIHKVLIALAVGGVAFGFWLMLPDVLRIWTPQGEIVIETEDPNVQIEVLQDGQLIHILDTRSQRSLKIAAGTYSIQPSRSVSDEATFQISPGVVELTRGEQRIVRVTKISPEQSPIEDAGKSGQTTNHSIQPTYQGRTLKQWIDILNAEQDFKTLATGIEAISLFVTSDSPELDVAIELVRKVMRQFGTDSNPGGSKHNLQVLRSAYDSFFSKIPPERTLEFLKFEMQHGNMNSFTYLYTLSHALLGDSPVVEPLRKLIGESERELCEIYIKAIHARVESKQISEAFYLGYLAYSVHFWQPKILQRQMSMNQSYAGYGNDIEAFYESQRQINLEIGPTLLENRVLFADAFRTADNELSKILFALFFRRFHQSHPEIMREVAGLVTNSELDHAIRWLAFETWLECTDQDLESSLPVLLSMAREDRDDLGMPLDLMRYQRIFQPGIGQKDVIRVELKDQFESTKTLTWSRGGLSEEPSEVRQMGFSSLPLSNGREFRIILLQRLYRVQTPSVELRALMEPFLREQILPISEEMRTAIRQGITINLTTEERQFLGEVYWQVVVNHLATLILQKWGLESATGTEDSNP